MENMVQKNNSAKLILYLVGYFTLGIIYLVINAIPIPFGGIIGAIRIYQYAKKDSTYTWKVRLVVLIIAIILGSKIFPIFFQIPIALNFGQH